MLRVCRDYGTAMLRLCCHHVATMVRLCFICGPTFPYNTFPDNISADLGSVLGRFEVDLGSILSRFGVDFGSIWGQFGIDLGSIWGRFGVDLGSVCQHLGNFGGKFAEMLSGKVLSGKAAPYMDYVYDYLRLDV